MNQSYGPTRVGSLSRAVWGAAYATWLILGGQMVFAQDQVNTQWRVALDELAESYSIQVEWESLPFPVMASGAPISGSDAEEKPLSIYASLWIREWRLYPKELIYKTGLQRVVLCTGLSYDRQLRTAVPDFEHDTLYLDVERGAHDPAYVRKVIHHEFFHMIDYCDDGQVYSDSEWGKLNADDFRYGDGGRNAQDNGTTSLLTEKYPGFLNHYSTTGVEEDKAEIFTHMIVEPRVLSRRAENDPVIQRKIERMKRLLQDFCPEMDATFWQRVADARVGRTP